MCSGTDLSIHRFPSPLALLNRRFPINVYNRSTRKLTLILSVAFSSWWALGQQPHSAVPNFQVTSRLVYLDVTVLDKEGNPVVTGLTKDDFAITEDKRPQAIFSFEPPEPIALNANEADHEGPGNRPAMIQVLDRLNSQFEDFSFLRQSMRKYLEAQPDRLAAPAELMVLDNQSLELAQGYTRNKADLLYALDHVPRALPYKLGRNWNDERLAESIEALQQIALQNKTISGRKNLVWLGYGGPNHVQDPGDPANEKDIRFFVHDTTNMLVEHE
jgi:VWFA-related protein